MTAAKANGDPIRVLAFLDDIVVSGNVKPVLALARCAREAKGEARPLEVSMVAFSRTDREPALVTSLRDEGLVVDVVRERRRFDFGVVPQLRAIVERRRPHVLWTHGAKPHFLVRMAGLHHKKAWAAVHHGYTATSLTWKLYDQLDRWSLHGADAVMTVCDAFAADLHAKLGIKPERLSVHRSPIVMRRTPKDGANAGSLRRRLDLAQEARIVLSVGRLSAEKGHADLIRAMVAVRQLCDFETLLVIVGDGPERAQLERLSARLGIQDAVRFVGYQRDVTAYYDAADVFALTSHSEGSPNVLLEAMDAELPIVATAVGGIGEMIVHGEHGLLVPRGDIVEIARSIAALLGDPDLGRTLTVAARQSLAAYSPEEYYAGVRSLFAKLVG